VETHGVPPASPDALVGTGGLEELPLDPLAGTWVIDVDGVIRSTVDVEDRHARGILRERAMLTTQKMPG
jgi:hypothetical protein